MVAGRKADNTEACGRLEEQTDRHRLNVRDIKKMNHGGYGVGLRGEQEHKRVGGQDADEKSNDHRGYNAGGLRVKMSRTVAKKRRLLQGAP